MTKTEPAQIVKREVGEKVKLKVSFDKGSVKEVGDEGNGVLEAVVTTGAEDRHGENIITAGIDTKNYMEKNPVVLYGHDYFGFPVGKTLKLTEMKNKIKAQFQLAVNEYDFAATLYRLVKGGYVNAVSIGGIVKKWSDDYRTIEQMEMVEFSLVAIPANADAMITSRSFEEVTGKSFDTVSKEIEDLARETMLDKISSISDDELNDSIKVLRNLIDRLEESASDRPSADEQSVKVTRHVVLRDARAVATQSTRVLRTVKLSLGE